MMKPDVMEVLIKDLDRRMRELQQSSYKRGSDVEVNTISGGRKARFIFSSPDGTRWALIVDDSGVVGTEAA